jgi:signal transduction histidine kinase
MAEAAQEEAMKTHGPQKNISGRLLWEMLEELGRVVRQSLTDSWLARISLVATGTIILFFCWTRLVNVLTTQGFGPHGACLLWLPGLITLYVGSDTLIGLAYVSISATLIYLVYTTRRTIPFQWVFVAFGIFIIACGTTHFLDVWTLWVPSYWLLGTVKLLTALASVTTALALPPLVPKVLALMHLSWVSEERKRQLEQARQVLQQEVATQNQNLVLLAEEVALRKRENQQALETLQHVNEQLTHANQVQRNFVAVVSHEFRTALTGIQGFSELMQEETFSQEEIKEFAGDISAEASRLSRMIADLLDLERMKSGRMLLTRERIDLNALIREVVERLRPTASGHSLSLQLDSTLSACMGDHDKLAQVVTNLLSNAIKYSPRGGEIIVRSQVEQEVAHVWVQDYGLGIPPEAFEEVFVPYSRIEAGTTRYIKGTGLGLSISRQIIELHGGHIWVESSLGQGSRFHLTIPLAN